MAKAKYLQFYEIMYSKHKELFDSFKPIHDAFEQDRSNTKKAEEFHEIGQKVVDRIRDWDRRLCAGMGKGKYSQYTQKLSQKFWDKARSEYALIDMVGVKTRKVDV